MRRIERDGPPEGEGPADDIRQAREHEVQVRQQEVLGRGLLRVHGRIGVLHRHRLSAVFHEPRRTDGVEIVDVVRGESVEHVHGRSRTRIAQAAGIESRGVEVLECAGVR